MTSLPTLPQPTPPPHTSPLLCRKAARYHSLRCSRIKRCTRKVMVRGPAPLAPSPLVPPSSPSCPSSSSATQRSTASACRPDSSSARRCARSAERWASAPPYASRSAAAKAPPEPAASVARWPGFRSEEPRVCAARDPGRSTRAAWHVRPPPASAVATSSAGMSKRRASAVASAGLWPSMNTVTSALLGPCCCFCCCWRSSIRQVPSGGEAVASSCCSRGEGALGSHVRSISSHGVLVSARAIQ